MRVVMARSKSPAGIEPRIDREARALSKAGHEVNVLLWDRRMDHASEEEREGYTIIRCHLPAPEGQIGLIPQMARWWLWELRVLMKLRPDAVHSCDLDTAIPAILYAKITGRRLVYDIFDFYAYMIAQPIGAITKGILAKAERFIARRADLVILADMARAVQLGGGVRGHIEEIMNVPEQTRLEESEEHEFTIFYGGMISEERGLRQLVQATSLAGAKLIVAGHGADEASLIPLFKQNPHVTFLGNIPYEDVLRWTARCHLIGVLYDPAIPNNRLASPNKLFEAMMLSKPVITNEGIRPADIVRDIGCGLVVNYSDADALSGAIKKLMSSPATRQEMGEKGRQAFEQRFNWTAMEKRLTVAYGSL